MVPATSARHRPLLLALVVLVALVGALQIWMAWRELIVGGMDIQQDYIAAQRLRAGGDIYAPIAPAEVAALGVREELGFGMRQNVHPPSTALLFAPLTLLAFPAATLVWTLGSVALLLAMAYRLIAELDLPLKGPWRVILTLLMLSWYPVWLHLHLGQITILLCALVFGAWYCMRRGRDGMAGALLAAAAILKIYPALLLGYALLRRRWRMLWVAAAVGLALLAAQTAFYPRQWLDYFTAIAPRNAAEWTNSPRNASLASIGTRLFVGSDEVRPLLDLPGAEPLARVALYALALGVVALVLWRRRRVDDRDGEYSLLVCAMVLLSPLSWEHSFIFLLLPLGVVWRRLRAGRGAWRRLPLLFAVAAVALTLLPAEIVLLRLKGAYLPDRMPGWVGLLAPGVAVLLCGFAAIVSLLWLEPATHTQDLQG